MDGFHGPQGSHTGLIVGPGGTPNVLYFIEVQANAKIRLSSDEKGLSDQSVSLLGSFGSATTVGGLLR